MAVKLEPGSLNESTLEVNIISEIASFLKTPFYPWILPHFLLDLHFFPHSTFQQRKTKLIRLTPIEENKGGGWDTKIVIPMSPTKQRATFIQFKAGQHKKGNKIPNSIFRNGTSASTEHAQFQFNGNRGNNQHKTLKQLAKHLNERRIPSKAVLYAFPRVTQLDKFYKLEDELLFHTSFLTLSNIEKEAKKNNSDLSDGKAHYFRTCYTDVRRREVSSDVFQLDFPDETEDILYEIFLVKIADLRNRIYQSLISDDIQETISESILRNIDYSIYFQLAVYFKIDLAQLIERNSYSSLYLDFFDFNFLVKERNKNYSEVFGVQIIDNNSPFEWRESLVKKIIKFLRERRGRTIKIDEEVPSEYSFTLPSQENMVLTLEGRFNGPIEAGLLIF
jgi:hypothetical protein